MKCNAKENNEEQMNANQTQFKLHLLFLAKIMKSALPNISFILNVLLEN